MDGIIRALRLDGQRVVLREFHDSSGIRWSVRSGPSHCSDDLRVSRRLVRREP